ncbi:TPA: DEAD/DEAH box helicase [Listeria monocytogenes]|nr:DEAD/DEAH box helicase [Listeria monocytogenes]EAE1994640.1 DEAD/DEAH box helicase [Listeria monocytogenes]EAG5896775.1 DEAD/DEAH box helicase [Listeria monocytogenes]EAG5897186.1 DEAD/DEAH box helicase [Listeria monocytogenes]EHH8220145.1 DEAD/DEAH box helicase [Listeria monocytogenes]
MKYKPHEYQSYATEFILSHPISAVFLEMGLGKSVITLSAIFDLCLDSFLVCKVLVIAPLRVARDTWPAEINKWDHLKGLSYSVVVGTEKERIDALKKQSTVYIINRENVDWLVHKSGIPFHFDMVVIDELSSFKSYGAKRFKSLLKVRPSVKRIVGLTGTPSSNGLMDLWAEFRILDLGQRLGRYISHYRNTYFKPDKRNAQIVFSYKPLPGAEEEIYNQISDITISMKSTDYLKMPEYVSNEVFVTLSEKEWKVYSDFKEDMVANLGDEEIDAVNAAVLSGKLLQMANGAVYDSENKAHVIHDKKLDALEDLIEGANGKPVLVAYWYKHDLERIKERFPVRQIQSSKDIEDWNDGKIPIAVIHPASAGHGLNLQSGGSTLIWFGLTWSLELYQQTNARLYRQGQKNTVIVHHIITKDTIDEDVLLALTKKEKTQDALIDAVKANLEVMR